MRLSYFTLPAGFCIRFRPVTVRMHLPSGGHSHSVSMMGPLAKLKALICNLALPQPFSVYTQLDLHCISPSRRRPPMSADRKCTRLHHLALLPTRAPFNFRSSSSAGGLEAHNLCVPFNFLSLSLQLSPSCTSARCRQYTGTLPRFGKLDDTLELSSLIRGLPSSIVALCEPSML